MPTPEKYKLVDAHVDHDIQMMMYRVKALYSFRDVFEGDIGGLVEGTRNLNQFDKAWIYDDAKVWGNALVWDKARVHGNAQVLGNAQVFGLAEVSGTVTITENAMVYGSASVTGNAWVHDDARIFGRAIVTEDAQIYGKVYDNAIVKGSASVWHNAEVKGTTVCNRSVPRPQPRSITEKEIQDAFHFWRRENSDKTNEELVAFLGEFIPKPDKVAEVLVKKPRRAIRRRK